MGFKKTMLIKQNWIPCYYIRRETMVAKGKGFIFASASLATLLVLSMFALGFSFEIGCCTVNVLRSSHLSRIDAYPFND